MKRQHLRFVTSLSIVLILTPWAPAQEVGRDVTRSLITIIGMDGKSRVVLDSERRVNAVSWSATGSFLVFSAAGTLWRLPITSGHQPEQIQTRSAGWIDINQGISPDGKTVAFSSAGKMSLMPLDTLQPRLVTERVPTYFHGWSPDGKTIVYAARRGLGCEIFAVDVDGQAERRLTTKGAYSDSPSFSPDGAWIYFNADYSGASAIWRVPAKGEPDKIERVFADDRENWNPRPSPDAKWLVFLSYPKKTEGHPSDRDVTIRRMPLPGTNITACAAEEVVRFVGGHGSLGAQPWSPDGRQLVYVTYEPPPPSVRIVLFTPSDVPLPAGANPRLTKIAEATEKFFFEGMKRWRYPAAVTNLFRRETNGSVEVLEVRGDEPASSRKYARPNDVFAEEVISKATRKYRVAGDGHFWWVFVHLGERPARFGNFAGGGNPRDGGWAMVNYDSAPGEIRPDQGIVEGFNGEFFLRGTIHELGHAFGLPHAGPDLPLGLGNSLMGPTTAQYAGRGYPNANQAYLSESSAAMLWKHPLFTGTDKNRFRQPVIKLADCRAAYSSADDRVMISGKIGADQTAHSVVVIEDIGRKDEHWQRNHSARIAADGTFQVTFDHPTKVDGQYRIRFCFENGITTGDGFGIGMGGAGDIREPFHVRDGKLEFAGRIE